MNAETEFAPAAEEEFVAMPVQARTDFLNSIGADERAALFASCSDVGRRAFNECPIKGADTYAAEEAAANREKLRTAHVEETTGTDDEE